MDPIVDNILQLRTLNEAFSKEQEDFTSADQLNQIYTSDLNKKDYVLKRLESKITSNNVSHREVEEDTNRLYKIIYVIFMTVFVLVILGIFTHIKNALSLSNKVYMLFVSLILMSYLFFIMYLYNWMYVKDSTNNLLHFVKYGTFDQKFEFSLGGDLPHDVYVKDLCRKKAAQTNPVVVSENPEEEEASKFIKSSAFRKSLPDNRDVHFYNDGNAPKLMMYPTSTPESDYGMIYYPDSNSNRREYERTYQL